MSNFGGRVKTHQSNLPHKQGTKFLPEKEFNNYLLILQKIQSTHTLKHLLTTLLFLLQAIQAFNHLPWQKIKIQLKAEFA